MKKLIIIAIAAYFGFKFIGLYQQAQAANSQDGQ